MSDPVISDFYFYGDPRLETHMTTTDTTTPPTTTTYEGAKAIEKADELEIALQDFAQDTSQKKSMRAKAIDIIGYLQKQRLDALRGM